MFLLQSLFLLYILCLHKHKDSLLCLRHLPLHAGVGLVALNRELGCLEPNLSADSVPLTMIRLVNDIFSALNEAEMGVRTWTYFRTKTYVKLETAHNSFLESVIN